MSSTRMQVMRYGAFRGPRLLTLAGASSPRRGPGGNLFPGMYREADGALTTPASGRARAAAARGRLRQERHLRPAGLLGGARGPRPGAHAEEEHRAALAGGGAPGWATASRRTRRGRWQGTELAIEEGVHIIEHGMILEPAVPLVEADGREPVRSLCSILPASTAVAGRCDVATRPRRWSLLLPGSSAEYNLEQADLTLRAARAAGVPHRPRARLGRLWKTGDRDRLACPVDGLYRERGARRRRP